MEREREREEEGGEGGEGGGGVCATWVPIGAALSN